MYKTGQEEVEYHTSLVCPSFFATLAEEMYLSHSAVEDSEEVLVRNHLPDRVLVIPRRVVELGLVLSTEHVRNTSHLSLGVHALRIRRVKLLDLQHLVSLPVLGVHGLVVNHTCGNHVNYVSSCVPTCLLAGLAAEYDSHTVTTHDLKEVFVFFCHPQLVAPIRFLNQKYVTGPV